MDPKNGTYDCYLSSCILVGASHMFKGTKGKQLAPAFRTMERMDCFCF